MTFRKPIDLKFGPDGCLYVIDYGNIWAGNTDGQILRIVYRRGNRPPVAVAKATPEAGKQPLEVHLSARESSDKDAGDQLSFAWRMGPDKPIFSHDAERHCTFDRPGTYPVELTVSDSHGANVCDDGAKFESATRGRRSQFSNLDTAVSSIGEIGCAIASK